MSNSKEKIKNHNNISKSKDLYKWFAYVLGSIGQLFNFFNRVNISVLVPYFIEKFKVSSSSIGLMSSVYFYSCAALQPVIGVLTDRFKPRRILTVSFVLITLGTLIYAYSPSFAFIFIGRLLIGVGSAGIFVPASWIITKYFSPDKRGFLFAIFLIFGGVGSMLASYPFAKLLSSFGFKNALIYISFASFALAVLIWLVIREDQPNKIKGLNLNNKNDKSVIKTEEEKINLLAIFRKIVSIPVIKYGVIVHTILYSTLILFQGLWAVPFFIDVYKMERTAASGLVTMIFLGYLAGGLVLGRLLDTKYAKILYLFASISRLVGYLFFFLYMGKFADYNFFKILLFIWGFCGAPMTYIFKVYSVVLPKKNYGAAIGILEVFPLIGCALYQSFSGILFDLFGEGANILRRSAGSYKIFFLFLMLSLAFAIFFTLKMIRALNKDYQGQL